MCQFHFSYTWADRYEKHDETNPLLPTAFPDDDIPSYLKLIRQQGIVLYGNDADKVIPEISDEQFWKAISDGIENFQFADYGLFDSNILTLSRILSFAYTRKIMTKVQGAMWGIAEFHQYKTMLEMAIDAYTKNKKVKYDELKLKNYKEFMIERIFEGLR